MPIVIPFVDSTVLVAEKSMTGVTGNFYCGLHEFEDMAFLLHFLRSNELFIDVGANVGSYTILASGAVGAKTICIEPVRNTYEKLLRNVRINDLSDIVRTELCAISDNNGELRFSTDRDTMNSVVDDSYQGVSELIPVRKLDDVLENYNPVMMKIDVEGHELSLLRGATRTLVNPTLQVIFLEGQNEDINGIMKRNGFQMACYDPKLRLVFEQTKRSGPHTSNQLWIRNIEEAGRRCSSAKKFNAQGMLI